MKRYLEKYKYIFSVITILCFLISPIQAQPKFSDNLKLLVNYHTGYNLPEYQFFTTVTNDYVRSLDVCLIRETHGKNSWEQLFNYPEHGISLFYSSLGNDEKFGRELAVTYFFKVNFNMRKRYHFYNRTGIGLGYVNRIFDLKTNYMNVAVGSHLNIHFNFRMGLNYILSKKLELNSGLSFDHFSNANTHEPNLGINYVTAFGGLCYRIGKETEKLKQEIEPHISKNKVEIFASIGGKHTGVLSTKYNMTSSLSAEMKRSFFRAVHAGVGVDLFYDASIKPALLEAGKEYKKINDYQAGIHISEAFVYNRFSIILQEGLYLYQVNQKHLMYNRGIINYNITNHLSVRISMKSYIHILDYPELGIGIIL